MFARSNGRYMDFLKEIEEKEKELDILYTILALQKAEIDKQSNKIEHLEKLLKFEPKILKIENKE